MNVMRVGQGTQPVASPERAYAGGGEVHRYVLAAVLAKYFQPHCKQFTFLRTAEFCRSNSNYYWKNWPGRWGEFRGARVRTLEKFTLLMFGIRLAVKYAVESWMSPWIVHQSYQGSAPGCSGVLHQVGRAPLQRYTEVGLRRGWQLGPLPAQYQFQRVPVEKAGMRKKGLASSIRECTHLWAHSMRDWVASGVAPGMKLVTCSQADRSAFTLSPYFFLLSLSVASSPYKSAVD